MKRIGKVILCLLALVLAAYLLFVDYPQLLENLSSNVETAYEESVQKTADTSRPEEEEDSTAENDENEALVAAQTAALEEELEQLYQECGATSVALCFDQIEELVYSDVYPTLATYDAKGNLVFTDGWLTGDYNQMQTRDFLSMMDDGWTYAIGGDDSLELSGTDEENLVAWQANLEEYMEQIRVRTSVIPTVYCFNGEEYLSDYDEILEENGFTAILYSSEDAEKDDSESGLQKVVGITLSEDTQAENLLETLQAYSGAVLVAQIVDSEPSEEGQITMESYLALLEELRSSDSITITTLDAAIEAATDEEQGELRSEIQEKENELAELEAQSTE